MFWRAYGFIPSPLRLVSAPESSRSALAEPLGVEHPWVALARLVQEPPAHSGFALVKAAMDTAIKVALTIVPFRLWQGTPLGR
jgi:hypothetical protein